LPAPPDRRRPSPSARSTARVPPDARRRRPGVDAARVAATLATRDRRRIGVFLVIVCVVLAAITVRLGNLQLMQRDHWRQEALSQSRATTVLPADRGTIFDRNLRDLALSVPRDSVYADPMLVQDPPYYADTLAPYLGISTDRLEGMLSRRHITVHGKQEWSRYVSLAPAVDAGIARRIDAMRFPGVYTRPEPQREYPDGTLAAAVLGRSVPGVDGPVGASGLEAQYDHALTGTPGLIVAERDAEGVEIPYSQRRYEPAHAGDDIVLSIDEGTQYNTERVLLDQVVAQGARGGMAIIVDVRTGDVLAMASAYGPRNGRPAHVATARDANLPLTFTYNPGSVMKIVTISTALQTGCITPSSTFAVPYSLRVGRFTVKDDEWHATELMTPRDILVHSSNVGTVTIAERCLTPDTLDAALRRFGFGAKSGLGFPREERGLLVSPAQYYDSGVASNAIGYSLLATPMQVLDAYTAIARGGVPIEPRLVDAFVDANGTRHPTPARTQPAVVSAATAATMQDMFGAVVRLGTGVCAAVPDYEIAGKTGTSQKQEGGAYTSASHVATFVGFAGGDAPQLAAIVVLDNPRDVYAARAAAPVFSEIMRYALVQMRVPPVSAPGSPTQWSQAAGIAAQTQQTCTVPHGTVLNDLLAQRAAAARAAAEAATSTTTSTVPAATAPKRHAGANTTSTSTGRPPNQGIANPTGTVPAAGAANH
jgi:cell division protein FtsI (penicillin-binding protein 3)